MEEKNKIEENQDNKVDIESMKIDALEELQEDENDRNRYFLYLFIFTVILFFCVFGITYSIYKGDDGDDNEIITDQIIFTYSDVDKVGNGIMIQNATPVSDSMGKAMVGKNQYFDFFITATTNKRKVLYQLLLNKDVSSTLADEKVRIYLTQIMGSYEQQQVLSTFSNLEKKTINNRDYYVLYKKELGPNLKNYSDSYRLRMWVADGAVDYENERFSVKVDVYAEQIGE